MLRPFQLMLRQFVGDHIIRRVGLVLGIEAPDPSFIESGLRRHPDAPIIPFKTGRQAAEGDIRLLPPVIVHEEKRIPMYTILYPAPQLFAGFLTRRPDPPYIIGRVIRVVPLMASSSERVGNVFSATMELSRSETVVFAGISFAATIESSIDVTWEEEAAFRQDESTARQNK